MENKGSEANCMHYLASNGNPVAAKHVGSENYCDKKFHTEVIIPACLKKPVYDTKVDIKCVDPKSCPNFTPKMKKNQNI